VFYVNASAARKTSGQLVNRNADFLQNESIRIDLFKINRSIDSHRES